VRLTIYANGFTVDDGPLRLLSDDANKPFLQDLAHGRVPQELAERFGSDVAVQLKDSRGEEYKEPVAPSYVAYSGSGATAGGGGAQAAAVVAEGAAHPEVVVDEAQPTTTVQIRLAGGKRMRAKLNLTHTVRHVFSLIAAEGAGGAAYVLMAGFPPAQLTDHDATIEAAGLKGAAITQKLA